MTDPSGPLSQAIWQTLAYADIFSYPLTTGELLRYLIGVPATPELVAQALSQHPGQYETRDGFYTLPGRSELILLRQQRSRVSARLWKAARYYGKLIARLPNVRMVAVTGALAMDNVDSGADIDYLIVTEPGRLWTTRALVLAINRLARLKGFNLCPNYMITLRALTFSDQTLYTAHELVQMVPLAGIEIYEEIRRLNTWALHYLPNAVSAPGIDQAVSNSLALQPPLSRPRLEAMLRLPLFAWFEGWEMRRKLRRLRRAQQSSPESSFSADICKGHDQRHQARTSQALGQRLQLYEQDLGYPTQIA